MLLLLIVPVCGEGVCMVVDADCFLGQIVPVVAKTISRGSSVGVLKLHENTSEAPW